MFVIKTICPFLLIISCLSFFPLQSAADQLSRTFPTIDGKIDEAEWAGAKTFSDFHIVVPKTDAKFYDSTLVYLKQSSDALYFAFKFYPRSKVIRQSLIRDVSSDEENEFFIVLDLENRNENGYIFIFNFINNQRDMAIYNQRTLVFEWDWIWECKSIIHREATATEPGYIETEVKIPVDKIQNKNRSQIGIDLQLFAYKADGSSYFYALTPESEILTVKGTHKLDIQPFEERLTPDVTAIPFVVGRSLQGNDDLTAGGDLNLSLDRHKLKATFNTDESTLEADPFQFSLYRQAIFLTERRPFLSKDLDIYRTPINLFYTRSIQEIEWGANYTFRSNNLKTGIIAVEDERGTSGSAERRQLAVVRPNYQSSKFNVGSTLLFGRNTSTRETERMASVDALVNLPMRLRFFPQYATNSKGSAYQVQLSLPQNIAGGLSFFSMYRRFGKNFDVSTLFNAYGSNYDEVDLNAGYRIVNNRRFFSAIDVFGGYYRARALDDTFTFQEGINFGAANQIIEQVNLSHNFDINRPDDMTPSGIVQYKNFLQDHSAKFLFGPHAITLGYNFGDYFGTYLRNPHANARIMFWDRLAFNVSFDHRGFADVKQTIYRIKMDLQLLEKLYLRSIVQKDNYRRLGLWNTLLQYEFFAGSNVYLVLNQTGDHFQETGKYFKMGYEVNF